MGLHRVWIEGIRPQAGQVTRLTGDEARHAVRVKRVGAGEGIELLDGAGFLGRGVVEATSQPGSGGAWLDVRMESAGIAPPVSPRLEVCSATPKGQRAADLVEQLSQIGAASWRPLDTERGVVDPGDMKLDRLRRVALESAKQCGRAWVMEIGEPVSLDAALRADGATVVVADGAGGPYSVPAAPSAIRVLIGPEGGWTDAERARFTGTTAVVLARFGPHVMRIETAAVAAAAVVLHAAC